MNTNDSSGVIDEDEIRAAIRFFDFDREAFNSGVRERVERGSQKQGPVRQVNQGESNWRHDHGGLLRVAASVVPFHLLGGSGTAVQLNTGLTTVEKATAAQSSLAAVGGVKKLFALIAMPAMSLLMVSVTIVSFFRIRKAQQSENTSDADVVEIQEALSQWWRHHWLVAGAVFVLAMVAPFLGWTTALLVVFIASILAATSLVVTLGRAGLVDRRAVGSYCIPVLGFLGQLSFTFGMTNRTALLDPVLVTVTCFAGAGVLAVFVSPFTNTPQSIWGNRLRRIFFTLGCGIFIFFGAKTVWKPIKSDAMVRYVENFETDLLGRWKTWQVTAEWLDDQNIEFDRTGVRSRFLAVVGAEKHKRYLFGTGVSTGLVRPSELIEDEDLIGIRQRLLDEGTANISISSVGQVAFVIETLADAGDLSQSDQDHLVSRLMVTWNELGQTAPSGDIMTDADVITRMLGTLNPSQAFVDRQADVRRWLNERQVTQAGIFSPSGGFQSYSSIHSSDPCATAAAVRLMQSYGVSDVIDVLALRSYLRPKTHFGLMTDTEMMRASTLERLNQVPGISRPTLGDYLVRDRSLWFAMALVGLCIYATLGSPILIRPLDETS